MAALAAMVVPLIPLQSRAVDHSKPADHVVIIEKFRFVPSTLRVRPNDTITWINRDIIPHTATAKDNSWDTGEIKKDQSKSLKITANMAQAYVCGFHPGMKARLEIYVEN